MPNLISKEDSSIEDLAKFLSNLDNSNGESWFLQADDGNFLVIDTAIAIINRERYALGKQDYYGSPKGPKQTNKGKSK